MSFRTSFASQLRSIAQNVFGDAEVYPTGVMPSGGVTRYLAYQRVSSNHARHFTGGSGLANPRYQVTSWARHAVDANALAEAVRKHLDNRRGGIGDADDIEMVHGSLLDDDRDVWDAPQNASQQGWHGVTQDFTIWHEETETPSP